jgi:beta-hydroxylase
MAETSTVKTLKEKRRKYVRRLGKPILRAIDDYVGRHSLVPNAAVLDSGLFPWVSKLEDKVDRVLRYRDSIPRFQDVSRDQYKISPDDMWKTFVLYGFGFKSALNCSLCPKTTAILEGIPGLQTAFFSILAPGKHVPRHKGVRRACCAVISASSCRSGRKTAG